MRSILTLGLLVCLGSGCAGESGSARETTREPTSSARLNLGVRLSDGRWLELAALRGTPVLVFVFATFDAVSQAALNSLRPFVPQHPELVVVGIAAQPRAAQLVEAWDYALDPPFVVGANPYGRVENGESMLGKIEIVPIYILFDANGYEIGRAAGLVTEGDLARLVAPVSGKSN